MGFQRSAVRVGLCWFSTPKTSASLVVARAPRAAISVSGNARSRVTTCRRVNAATCFLLAIVMFPIPLRPAGKAAAGIHSRMPYSRAFMIDGW